MSVDTSTITAVTTVIVASMALYLLAGRLGKSSRGSGVKYSPFTGGEKIPEGHGKYHSELFVYAALFMVFEVFALILAGAIHSSSSTIPLIFTATGAITIFTAVIWFVQTGGSKLA